MTITFYLYEFIKEEKYLKLFYANMILENNELKLKVLKNKQLLFRNAYNLYSKFEILDQ